MGFYHCMGCTKRYPGCHGTCPEYLEDKAKHEELKAKNEKERSLDVAIFSSRTDKVLRALKRHRKK